MDFAKFAAERGLVLNAAKTQLMWSGPRRMADSVIVEGVNIEPTNSLELLGVTIDSKLSLEPHLAAVARAARTRAAMVARLSCHLPRGRYLTQLAKGILIGKLSYAVAAVSTPRLEGDTTNPSANNAAIQVAVNDVARSISGCARRDHIKVQDLLDRVTMPSYNAISVRAVAMEAWKAFKSTDGPNCTRNPLGELLFPSRIITSDFSRSSRAASAGIIALPLRARANTFLWNAATIWNSSKSLREASTRAEALRVAQSLAKKAPV